MFSVQSVENRSFWWRSDLFFYRNKWRNNTTSKMILKVQSPKVSEEEAIYP